MMKLGLALLGLLLSAQTNAQGVYAPLTPEDTALLDSVTRPCGSRNLGYRDDLISALDGQNQISTTKAGEDIGKYVHVYSQQMWDAISAAARQLKALGWVVTDGYYSKSSLNNRVMSLEQYEQEKVGEKLICMGSDPVPMCDDTERRIARELFGFENLTPCGEEEPWDDKHPNALRGEHVRMIQTLIDQGYAYSEATKSFEKTEGGGVTGQGAGGALR